MITIEKTIELLKQDHNFREVIHQEHYYFNYSGLSFQKLSYDSREVDADTLFFAKGAQFKVDYLKKP